MDITTHLSGFMLEEHPRDAVISLSRFEPEAVAPFLLELPPAVAANLLRHMRPMYAIECLRSMNAAQAGTIIDAMPAEVAARILQFEVGGAADGILAVVSPQHARAIRIRMEFREDTIGPLVETTDTMPIESSVEAARQQIARTSQPYLYVVDTEGRLAGVVKSSMLWSVPPTAKLSTIAVTDVTCLNHRTPISAVWRHPAWADYDILPVVDARKAFVGVLRHKAIRRSMVGDVEKMRFDAAVSTLLDLGNLYWTASANLMLGPTSSRD